MICTLLDFKISLQASKWSRKQRNCRNRSKHLRWKIQKLSLSNKKS